MKHNDITIIVLLYKTPKKLIKNLVNYNNFKISILDQSGDYKLKKILTKLLPNIINYEVTKTNEGFAKAQNRLIKNVKTRYFFSTQADVTIKENSIISLKKTLKRNVNNLISIPCFKNFKINKKFIVTKEMTGTAFMAKTKIFKKFGMFDEFFFFYWEDIDLAYRINKSKYKIVRDLNSHAKHIGGKSTYNGIKENYIRQSNFRFGEYLFLYKNKKLRYIKFIREIILNILRFFLNFLFLRINKMQTNIFNLVGIMKFIIIVIVNKF